MRTHFSDDVWMKSVSDDCLDSLTHQLNYFMWDTSTDTMCQVGLPSDDDVTEWILTLETRQDCEEQSCRVLIKSCVDYIG